MFVKIIQNQAVTIFRGINQKKRRHNKRNVTIILHFFYNYVTNEENILTFGEKIIKYKHDMM